MTIFRIRPDNYFGDDAILAYADRAGMRIFQSAVRSARKEGEATFEIDGIRHQIVLRHNAADIQQEPQTVVWQFDDAKLLELLDLIAPLTDTENAGHQYINLNNPVPTLTLSVNEYV